MAQTDLLLNRHDEIPREVAIHTAEKLRSATLNLHRLSAFFVANKRSVRAFEDMTTDLACLEACQRLAVKRISFAFPEPPKRKLRISDQ